MSFRFRKMEVDYSLYLVTDNTAPILKGRHLPTIVKQAIDGGATIVQLRDKTSDTGDLISIARELHAITRPAGVPLLINDRIDVALATDVEGVHIGQDDMDLATARKLLGKDKIIGVTASSIAETIAAAEGGADYLGLGTVFATSTKANAKTIAGVSGIRDMLDALGDGHPEVKTVCIGGINISNAQRVMQQSEGKYRRLDGVAVVSAIIGADDPTSAARQLASLVHSSPVWASLTPPGQRDVLEYGQIQHLVPRVIKHLGQTTPLCHNMTNLVVQNIAANVAICIGGSPIMSNDGGEAADLAKLGGSLVINMGTVTKDGLANYIQAIQAYNAVGGPILFDPVGAGATGARRKGCKFLMDAGYFDVMKGNFNEIATLAGTSDIQQRGVDGSGTASIEQRVELARKLAAQHRNVIVMTGKTDIVSDGHRTLLIHNGHEYLGNITGSGCTLGTTIAACLAVHRQDKMLAALAGILMFEIAAERAAVGKFVRGPGTFVPAFLDELYAIRTMAASEDSSWIHSAKVESV